MHLEYAFVEVDFYSSICDYKAQELASTNPENAFFWVEAYVVFPDLSESFFQGCHVLGYVMGFDDYVIDVDLDISSDLLFEDLIHQSLVCSAYVF